MDLLLPGGMGMQTVLTTLGMNLNLNNTTLNVTSDALNFTSFLHSPISSITSLAASGDVTTLFTRFVQFGALGSVLQWLGVSGLFSWAYYSLYDYIISRFVLRVYFDGDDVPYSWLMLWLSKQPAWSTSRDIQISSQNFNLGVSSGTLVPGEDTAGKEGQRPLSVLPWKDTTSTMWFKNRLMRVTRNHSILASGRQDAAIVITMYTRKHQILYDLLLQAKREYEAQLDSRIVVYNLDAWNNWLYCGNRPKRNMSSVIIAEETKELLLEDAKDFMDSEEWYGQRGIPWQRGWLLYGAPGSGKTSTIQAIAGELGLNIYMVSLSKRGLDDTSLNTLIAGIPARSMILMEDIDAAFTRSVTREAPTQVAPMPMPMPGNTPDMAPSSVTLSGLLNAIDGVQAQQGRLLFATTNKYDALDPALVRPGRLDLHVEFTNASKWQASELFKRFYPVEKVDKSDRSPNGSVHTAGPSRQQSSVETHSKPNGVAVSPESGLDEGIVLVDEPEEDLMSNQRIPATGAKAPRTRKAPRLSQVELEAMAKEFAAAIPEQELSMAAIQGHLMMHKTRPHEAVRSTPRFVIKERERKIKAREITKEQALELEKAQEQESSPVKQSSTPANSNPTLEYLRSRARSYGIATPPLPIPGPVAPLGLPLGSGRKSVPRRGRPPPRGRR